MLQCKHVCYVYLLNQFSIVSYLLDIPFSTALFGSSFLCCFFFLFQPSYFYCKNRNDNKNKCSVVDWHDSRVL